MSRLPDSVVSTELRLLPVLFATVVGMAVLATAVVVVVAAAVVRFVVLFVTVVVDAVVVDVPMSPVVEK